MKSKDAHQVFFWTPRILSLVFVGFLSLFALDVFTEYSGFAVVVPLLIHLIPSLILLALVIVAWKREIVGTITFLGFAVFYVYTVGFDRHWTWYAFISGPATIVGLLFLASWIEQKRS